MRVRKLLLIVPLLLAFPLQAQELRVAELGECALESGAVLAPCDVSYRTYGELNANRDLDGCRKVILDAVQQAQGKGCGPGILGVCIGGDRATGYDFSKTQFLRDLDDRNDNEELDGLEQDILTTANKLGIGPMGFGGRTTLLGVKITAANRLPASFFVSVSYMCWAFRRHGATLDNNGDIKKWLY
mgnify:CR=1 FL=1